MRALLFLIQPPLLTRAHGISSLVQARSNLKRDYADEGRDATSKASESADDVDETEWDEVRKRGRLRLPAPVHPADPITAARPRENGAS